MLWLSFVGSPFPSVQFFSYLVVQGEQSPVTQTTRQSPGYNLNLIGRNLKPEIITVNLQRKVYHSKFTLYSKESTDFVGFNPKSQIFRAETGKKGVQQGT